MLRGIYLSSTTIGMPTKYTPATATGDFSVMTVLYVPARGDDPLTTGQVPEIQSATCMGSSPIKFGFRDAYTIHEIRLDGPRDQNGTAKVTDREEVDVSFALRRELVLPENAPQTIMITFHNPGGDLPLITLGDDKER